MLTHVVLFRLRSRTPEAAAELCARLASLDGRVPSLRGIEAGADVVRGERSYDVALVARFDDRAGLAAYQEDPYHQQVVGWVRTVTDSSVTVDWED